MKFFLFGLVVLLYLLFMAGITVLIEGKTMKEVAYFVARKLAPVEYVTATATHFVLKTYKDKGVIYNSPKKDPRDISCI